MGMGYEAFRKKFVRYLGVSPVRYRESQRIMRAKRLLQTTSMSNKELAYTLGYCDQAHSSKAFKRSTGMSPQAFARAARRKTQ